MTFWDERRFTTISKEEINFSCARVGGWTHVKKIYRNSNCCWSSNFICHIWEDLALQKLHFIRRLAVSAWGLFLNSFTTQSGTFKSRRFFLRVHILLSWAFAASLSNSCHEEGLVKLKKAIYYMIAFTPSVYMYIHGEPIKLAIIYIMIVWRLVPQGNDPWILNMYIYNYIYIYTTHKITLRSQVESRSPDESSSAWKAVLSWVDWRAGRTDCCPQPHQP